MTALFSFKRKIHAAGKYIFLKQSWTVPQFIRDNYFNKKYIIPFKNKKIPTVYLETTSACNLNCVMCPTQRPEAKAIKPDGFIDVAFFKKIIDEIAEDDPNTNLRLHKDGEPLLHPNIIELIDYASSRLNNVSLVTNATLLDEKMTKAILKTNLQDIRFSIDGTKHTFEKIRIQLKDNPWAAKDVPVDYDSIISKVLNFSRLRNQSTSKIKIGVRMTDFKPTQNDQKAYKAFWKKHVDYIEIARYLSWTGKIFKSKKSRYPCMVLWNTTTISWSGQLVPCCVYMDSNGDGKGILADLNKPNITLKDAFYNSKSIIDLRRAHLDNDIDKIAPYCTNCEDWKMPGVEKVWTTAVRDGLS